MMTTDCCPDESRRHFLMQAGPALAALTFGTPALLSAASKSGLTPRVAALDFAYRARGMKNPVCIFSKHLQWLDFDDLGAFVHDLGFGGVDLTVRRGGHVKPEEAKEQLPRAVRALRRHGVETPMMATNINDPDDPLTEQILEVASGEGIRFYRMQYYRYPKRVGIIDALDRFRQKMEKLAELNARYGMHGAYQNHSGHYVGASIWDAWYLLRGLDPAYSGMQFDIRHAVVEGGLSWPVDMRLVRNFIRCTVAKDFLWEKDGDRYRVLNVPLGEGMVDFESYYRICAEEGITGPVSLHVEYDIFGGPEEEFSKKEKYDIAGRVLRKDLGFMLDHMKAAGLL